MPITAQWDNPQQTIIHYHFENRWTWDELYRAVNTGRVYQDSVNHRVDIILNFDASSVMPGGALSEFRRIAQIRHPNTGIRVIVGANPTMHTLMTAFTRTYRKVAASYRTAPSLQAAYALIAQERAALNLEES